MGPTGPDGDPWRPKADFLEAEGRRRGVWGRSPQENGALWGPIGGRQAFFLQTPVSILCVLTNSDLIDILFSLHKFFFCGHVSVSGRTGNLSLKSARRLYGSRSTGAQAHTLFSEVGHYYDSYE